MTKKAKRLTKNQDRPNSITSPISDNEMQREYDFFIAERILNLLLDRGFIDDSEYKQIRIHNLKTISPYLSDIIDL